MFQCDGRTGHSSKAETNVHRSKSSWQQPRPAESPQEQPYMTAVEILGGQQYCHPVGLYGDPDGCFWCTCESPQSAPPCNGQDTSRSEADVADCIVHEELRSSLNFGFVFGRSDLVSRWGCQGRGYYDKEAQYANSLFRPTMWSAWFQNPRGTNLQSEVLSIDRQLKLTLQFSRLWQHCNDDYQEGDPVPVRVGFRSGSTLPDFSDPHFSCIPDDPTYETQGKMLSGTQMEIGVPEEIRHSAAALGPDEWFAIDVAYWKLCPTASNHPEEFLGSEVLDATIRMVYPLLWVKNTGTLHQTLCCALLPDPTRLGSVLAMDSFGIPLQQWVVRGGVMRGIPHQACEFLHGRLIEGTPECLAIPIGEISDLTAVTYDWQ
eukprot:Protomagalhaensia_wolfi_Nauph_80__1034@NODE_15_length_5123_cov_187_723249_g11_i0_p2_GENE_NODE_15_length_5123_cov_187_723249_g11_i0NODE_15_length_5123_cov_187_723249_g11_i0_p2_ORF_typecomplete_len375_score41_71_NODE_15_length_5123_cov_187_723249_g11_i030214145